MLPVWAWSPIQGASSYDISIDSPDGTAYALRVHRPGYHSAGEIASHFDISWPAVSQHLGVLKEAGLVAVRVNDSIPEHKAVITNSTGATGEKNIWGKPADWADISGQINGKTYGVAAFDSPANPLHPQQWHIREYGLMGANPFGLSYYDKKIAKHAGDFKMPAGKTTTFHYLVVIHEGDAKAAKLDEKYKTFTGK